MAGTVAIGIQAGTACLEEKGKMLQIFSRNVKKFVYIHNC